jgi:hypothetical protein
MCLMLCLYIHVKSPHPCHFAYVYHYQMLLMFTKYVISCCLCLIITLYNIAEVKNKGQRTCLFMYTVKETRS